MARLSQASKQDLVADRAAFERHAESLGYSVDPDIRGGREGGYWSTHTHLMWETWQAAQKQPEQDWKALYHAQVQVAEAAQRRADSAQSLMDSALEQPEQEPVAWGCFKDGDLQTELVGTESDVDFWCKSDEPEMHGMVKGALYTAPPRRESLSVTDLQQALVDADLVDPDAIDDPEGFDNGFTLQQIDALHSRLMQTTPPTTTQPEPK